MEKYKFKWRTVQCKQHVHVQNLQFVISAEKATFELEKCLAMS